MDALLAEGHVRGSRYGDPHMGSTRCVPVEQNESATDEEMNTYTHLP